MGDEGFDPIPPFFSFNKAGREREGVGVLEAGLQGAEGFEVGVDGLEGAESLMVVAGVEGSEGLEGEEGLWMPKGLTVEPWGTW